MPGWTRSLSNEMASNRMTFEKNQRDGKKKRKAEEKRALRQKKKERTQSESESAVEAPSIDESTERLPHIKKDRAVKRTTDDVA